jgi:hypothetical protein
MANARRWIGHLALISAFAGGLVPLRATAQQKDLVMPNSLVAKDTRIAYRLNLLSGDLEAVNQKDMKVGCIYYHFSAGRNAWVWSYLLNDRTFWYAFGEGTTQTARRFDIRASLQDVTKRLEQFPELERGVNQYNQAVCLRLQADGRWRIVGTGLAPSIFNAETGERWQQLHKNEYIPIVHIGGNSWSVRNGSYEPSM